MLAVGAAARANLCSHGLGVACCAAARRCIASASVSMPLVLVLGAVASLVSSVPAVDDGKHKGSEELGVSAAAVAAAAVDAGGADAESGVTAEACARSCKDK